MCAIGRDRQVDLSLVNTTKMADGRLAIPKKANEAISTRGSE
jgi:hypothetical protein